ncbi:MAG: hypothetical protein KAU02_06175 [Tenericutes bacterium]|nr:hypothetical protein [Mycoplasmatota bacterium]
MGLKLYLEYHDNNDEVREEPPTKHRLYLGDYILLGTKSESIPVIRN